MDYIVLLHLRQSLVALLLASWTISKFNGQGFIGCPVLVQLPHLSCFFCEAMIWCVCIAIQVNMSCILPIKLTLKVFKKCWISCHNLFLLVKRKPAMHLKRQEDWKISFCGFFFSILGQWKCWNQLQAFPKRVKFQACFYQILLTISHRP